MREIIHAIHKKYNRTSWHCGDRHNRSAQEEEKPSVFTYATYFYCDVTGQDRVDEIVKTQNAPVYDPDGERRQNAGLGLAGPPHRRQMAPDPVLPRASSVAGLLDAQTEMNKRLDGVDDKADKILARSATLTKITSGK